MPEERAPGRSFPGARVSGYCDPRFAAVRGEFEANFADRGETGGGVCVAVAGTVVAELWGGRADAIRPYINIAGHEGYTGVSRFSLTRPLPLGEE